MVPSPLTGAALALVGLAALLAARLVYSPRRPALFDQVHLMIRAIGWALLAVGFLAAVQLVAGLGLGLLFWISGLILAGILASRYQATEQNALLWTLAVAAEKQMPLTSAVEAFAQEWGGQFGGRALRLAASLRAGLPLPEALDRQRGLLSAQAQVAARMGTDAGILGPALREAAVSRTFQEPVWHATTARLYYLLGMLFVAQLAAAGIVHFVSPRVAGTFVGYGVDLPPLAAAINQIAESPQTGAAVFTLLWIELGALIYLTLYLLDWIPWGLPLMNRLTRRFDTAHVLRALAWSTERGKPLRPALATLSQCYPKRAIRRRLAAVARDMASGDDWCERLHARGLISGADAAVLRSAQRVGNLPWALREVAASSERRLADRLRTLVQIVYPVVMLWMGLLGAVLVIGYFVPLINMIQKMV
jgi:type II secretory pathway component PulF